jgi:Secretion system C-terminal sorting domain
LVTFQPVAEGAIAPNLGMQFPDTLFFNHGTNMFYDTLAGYVVFKNISIYNFKPLKVRLTLTNKNGNVITFSLPGTKALAAGDTLHISFNVDVHALPRGLYNLHLTINPDNDQPEQYLFNNSLYKYVYISRVNVLPIKFTRFTAQQQNNSVRVSWSVTNENNIATYAVEHSPDGIHYTTVGIVKGSGMNTYTFTHNNSIAGSNYYRLKIVDANGTFTYSNIVVVQLISMLTVGPNPFYSYIKVTTGEPSSAMCSITVYSASGQRLLRKIFSGNTSINTTALAAGTYIIKVENSNGVIQTFKLQKQYR